MLRGDSRSRGDGVLQVMMATSAGIVYIVLLKPCLVRGLGGSDQVHLHIAPHVFLTALDGGSPLPLGTLAQCVCYISTSARN